MANTVNTTAIINGSRILVVEINVVGDGSGEESDTVVVDYSTLVTEDSATELALRKFYSNLSGFAARLEWDATTDSLLLNLTEGESGMDVARHIAPIADRSGAGQTGDVLMTTSGLGAGDVGKIILEFVKKG